MSLGQKGVNQMLGLADQSGLSALQDDPFAQLAASACNLVADNLRVRFAGVVNVEDAALVACSTEMMRLSPAVRAATAEAVADAVSAREFDAGEAVSAQLVEVPVDGSVGESAAALFFPESEVAVFAGRPAGRDVGVDALRRAAGTVLPIISQIEELRAERNGLIQSRLLLSHVQALSNTGGWERSLSTGKIQWTDAIYAIHGLEPGGEITLERMLELYPSPAREKLAIEMDRAAADGGGFDVVTPIRTPAGESRVVRTVGRSGTGPSGPTLFGITQDVTAQLGAERRLWWAVNHDPVTSLPNRLLFEDRLSVAISKARRENAQFALLIIEISDFARLNAQTGYTVPDKHMQAVGVRVNGVMRESDTLARISINEFAMVLHNIPDREALDAALLRVSTEIEEVRRDEAGGDGIVMSAGVALFPEHASGPEELIRAAEIALAQAKRRIDDPIIVFDRQIADDVQKRRESILARARESLARREFVPFYQPQFDIETNQVVGAEALVRWRTPEMVLDAKEFAYALDDHEIGSRVGRAMLDAVIADIAKIKEMSDRPFRISVNASRTELLRTEFLDTFLEKTRQGNLTPSDFIIEITEDVIIGVDDQQLRDQISYLVSSGVEFSLDDFGTGYASLIHILSFPVKEVKVDKQFIVGIDSDRRKRAVVAGIVQIGRSMGLNVIAEGVETPEQEEVLRDLGLRYVQGYLHSFPLPFAEFAELLERN